jgi:tetratricopeptide (TPR) repeat protein
MYLDHDYRPRRRRQSGIGRFWPLFVLAAVAIILYETQPGWLVERSLEPTPTPTRSAASFLAEAQAALLRGDYTGAISAYERVASLDPQNPEPYVVKSRLFLIAGDVEAAHDVAVKAVELAPADPDALAALARAEDWLDNYEAAMSHALDAYELQPDNPETLAIISEIYADVGNLAQAELYIDKALAIDPEHVLALRNQAYLMEKQRRFQEAIEALEQALALAPQRADLYLQKARIYRLYMGDFPNAIAAYRSAVDASKTPQTLTALGEGLYFTGDHLVAIRTLNSALELDPDHAPALVYLGMALYARRNYEDSAAALDKGLPIFGERTREEHYYTAGLAHVYKEPRECEEAMVWLQKALEKNPQSGPALAGVKLCADAPGG